MINTDTFALDGRMAGATEALVSGVVTPEPSSLLLLTIGGFTFLRKRLVARA